MTAHFAKFIAYYRVSTQRQGRSGLGIEAQRKSVTDHLNGGTWKLIQEFTEVETGKRNDRPQLAAALAACRKHKAKLIIAKLDRLARNVAFIANLMDSGVDFIACDFPAANRLTLHILAAVAEHEAAMISSRTKDALAAAKRRGVRLGNPRAKEAAAKGTRVWARHAQQRADNLRPIITEIRRAGIATLQGIADALNARGIKSARGSTWTAKGVSRVIDRTR
jgi:DNA invertase Pin-like site-specific DNA recombinase